MLPISSSSSFVYSLTSNPFCLISSFSWTVSNILLSFVCPPFYCFQFCSNLPQYSLLYCLSVHPNSFFTINLPGNSSLLNIPSSFSCCLISSISCQYSFSSSSIASLAFSKFFIFSQVSDSAVNPFYYTKYLFFFCILCLFSILSTSHSSSPSIITRASCSLFCPSTCPTYFHILLTLTTRCIFIVLGSSVFDNTILLIL